MFNKRVALNPDKTLPASLLPGPSQRLALVLKCRWFVFFNVTLLGIYRWLRYITGSLKSYPPFWKARGTEDSQEEDYHTSFLGNDTFPNLFFFFFFFFLLFSHNKDYTSITLYKDVARGPQKTTRLVRGGPLVTIILSNRTITTHNNGQYKTHYANGFSFLTARGRRNRGGLWYSNHHFLPWVEQKHIMSGSSMKAAIEAQL